MSPRTRLLAIPLLLTTTGLVLWGCNENAPVEPLGPTVPAGFVVAGTVVDTEGRPAEGAVIAAEPLVEGRAAAVAARLPGDPDLAEAAAKSAVASAVSDADGAYVLDGLDAGRWLLRTDLSDHLGDSRQVELAAAVGTTFVDIQLTPTGTLAGLATLENASLHDGTVVYVEGTSYLAVTDGAGSFAMTGVPVGSWDVRAFHAGYLDDATTGSLASAAEVDTLPDLFLPLDSNIPPVVDQIDVTPLAAGQPTSFVAQTHDDDGSVVRWEWDFQNDGTWDYDSAVTGDTSFAYAAVGPVTAKLRVTDDGGAIGLGVVSFEVPAVSYEGVFVSTTGDDGNAGTYDAPVQTIATAVNVAIQQNATDIWIETGVYAEMVSVPDGISLHGGRTQPTWDRAPGQYSTTTGEALAAGALGVSSATLVEGMEFVAADATDPGQASVALTLFACSADLVFEDCIFEAGNGADGFDGQHGPAGGDGQDGFNGAPGACDDLIFAPGGLEGGGGWAGGPGGNGGEGDSDGQNGFSSSGAPGGQGGNSGDPGQPGQNGFNGPDGGHGDGGSAAFPDGSLSITVWNANVSGSGSSGEPGEGGGGGGGGGGQTGPFVVDGTGNGGGGGGGGGFGGAGGFGGQGGGASICVILVGDSPTFVDCTFIMGSGGNGGAGGNGAVGGAGGQGGFGNTVCLAEVGRGGNGGDGGAGGAGGGGAGGPGGPCFGFYGPGSTPILSGEVFQAGTPGTGGSGGAGGGVAQAGADGPAGNVVNILD